MSQSKLRDFAISQIPFSIAKRAYSNFKDQENTFREKLKYIILDSVLCCHYILPIVSYFIAATNRDGTFTDTSVPFLTSALVGAVSTLALVPTRYGVYRGVLQSPEEDDDRDNDGFEPEPVAPPQGERVTDYYWQSRSRNRHISQFHHTKT